MPKYYVIMLGLLLNSLLAQHVVEQSAPKPPTWLMEPPAGTYYTYYSGIGSSSLSLASAKEQAISNVLSEIIMGGEITAQSQITTFQQQSNLGNLSEVTREIQQTGKSTTIKGLEKEEEYWETLKKGSELSYRYWILMRKQKPEYVGLEFTIKQGYGIAPVWRSILVPGWGQINKGESKKGIRILGAEAVLISTFLISQNLSHDYSRKASLERDADRRTFYNQMSNRSYAIALVSGIMGGVGYFYNVFDAVTGQGAKKYALTPIYNSDSALALRLAFNF